MVTKEQMNEVLRQLAAIYPAWQQAIKTKDHADNLKRVWWDEFNRLEMTPDDLKRGIYRARSHDSAFLPSLGQFIEWCNPGDTLGKNMAFQMACMQSDTKPITDPLVLEAARRTGSWDLKNKPERETRPLFFEHYERVLRERDDGAQFRLPAPKPEPVETENPTMSPEEQKRIMDELRGTLGVSQ